MPAQARTVVMPATMVAMRKAFKVLAARADAPVARVVGLAPFGRSRWELWLT